MWYDLNEDSYTFIDLLKEENIKNKIIIDLGTSTGVLSEALKGNLVIGVDLNRKALEEQQRLRRNPNLIRGDLLKSVNQGRVDIIIFNPPYVVDSLDPIIGGGPLGRIVIDKFIKEIEVDLFYLLVIKANRPEEVVKGIEEKGYKTKIMKIRRILGETIIIIKGEKLE
ncbi:N6 adenine specific dna methylase [Nosema bombycis CQ1]|uniref:N6 adenine specific dna methylase n=1 Tax=Nosema bombycis (strain CQ1 / CVCC 102059) TaxID=578461 RepID=R0M7Y9_NOSB1|nr:N6 adenine specific dna methylase [Nosema bombycis CQ1]|eukprot:EOB14114.1 N6 adenine specific dna methylase [Nosema bombycis CQ1]